MRVYCTQEFKSEFDKITKNKAYSTLEKEIVGQYCNTTYEEACTGDALGIFPNVSYLKKRLEGSGGYRVYIVGFVKNDAIYLAFVHPKTGPYGADNITLAKKKLLLKDMLAAIKNNELYSIIQDLGNSEKLVFKWPD